MSRLASIVILVSIISASFALSALEVFKYNLHSKDQTAAISGAGSGLVAHWTFDEGSGSTANDSAGLNNGTINGATWTTGKVGSGALKFDGVDDSVQTFANFTAVTESLTKSISVWVKPSTTSSGHAMALARTYGVGTAFGMYASGNWYGSYWTTTTGTLDTLVAVIPDTWVHLALVQNGSVVTFYIDGTLVATSPSNAQGVEAFTNFRIGARADGTASFFNGLIDDARIYNRALSAREIQSLYELGSDNAGDDSGETTNEEIKHYTLTISKSGTGSGTVTGTEISCGSDCSQANISSDTSVALIASPSSGSTFAGWSGGGCSGTGTCTVTLNSDITVTATFTVSVEQIGVCAPNTYYIDYENGDDDNTGKCTGSAWKHVPASTDAKGASKATVLKDGDTLQFKGGVVYRDRVYLANSPGVYTGGITLKGTGWGSGKAIISGADPLNVSWTKCDTSCGKNWVNLYQTTIGTEYTYANMDLFDDSGFLYIAQDPNPSDPFWSDNISEFRTVKKENLTRTTITDPIYINQTDSDYYKNAYVSIWVNPNVIATMKITGYNPSTNTISFESLSSNAIYGDRDQKYSIINALDTVDKPGEYYFDEANHKIILYPKGSLDTIEIGSRSQGIVYGGYNNLTIDGFVIEKMVGNTGAYSITGTCCQSNQGITVKNNEIRYARLRSAGNQATIRFSYSDNINLLDNIIHDNETTGASIGRTAHIEGNIFYRNGYKGLWVSGGNGVSIINNTFAEHNGTHGTDVSIFTSTDVLFGNNIIANSGTEVLSFENDTNLIIHGNLLIGANQNSGVIRQNGTNMKGYLVITNNTALGSGNNIALNSGGVSSDPPARYIVKNNIIDGWGSSSVKYEVSNNIYTGLSWSQIERYGWYFMPGEFLETNLNNIFQSTSNEFNGGYMLRSGSVAIDKGVSLKDILPTDVKTKFPNFDFTTDMDNTQRPQGSAWDIGAYEYPGGGSQPKAPTDTTAPSISNSSVTSITTTSAIIHWITNEPADTKVEYGLAIGGTPTYGSSTTLNTTLTTSHTATLTNLSAGTTYNYRLKSRDAEGNLTTTGNGTITTKKGTLTPLSSEQTTDSTNPSDSAQDASPQAIEEDEGSYTPPPEVTPSDTAPAEVSDLPLLSLAPDACPTNIRLFPERYPNISISLTDNQAHSILLVLSSFGVDQATVNEVQCALLGYDVPRASITTPSPSTPRTQTPASVATPTRTTPYTSSTFPRTLRLGDSGEDVRRLQVFLNTNGFTIAETGPGSPGNETDYFGTQTRDALFHFQEKYASSVLHPVGLRRGTGYLGASTIEFIDSLMR